MPKEVTVEIGGVALKLRPLSVRQVREFETVLREFDDSDWKQRPAQLVKIAPLVADALGAANGASQPGLASWQEFVESNLTVADITPVMVALYLGSEFKQAAPGEPEPAAAK